MEISPLQKARYAYVPKLPPVLRAKVTELGFEKDAAALPPAGDRDRLKALFPLMYGQDRVTFVSSAKGGKAEKLPASSRELKVGVITLWRPRSRRPQCHCRPL